MPLTTGPVKQRLDGVDWADVGRSLDAQGFAEIPPLLTPAECKELIASYGDDRRFRKRIDMESYVFGRGDYSYFARPLPALVQSLRTHLYRRLAPVANRWAEALGLDVRYPAALGAFLDECHAAEQTRPTPLILHYTREGYNRLHQDRYGERFFPLQVVCMLSRPGADYDGGELLLVEQRPRSQSRGHVIRPARGSLVAFASGVHPGRGVRGTLRLTMRHGLSTVTRGERYALGIIFHDAK